MAPLARPGRPPRPPSDHLSQSQVALMAAAEADVADLQNRIGTWRFAATGEPIAEAKSAAIKASAYEVVDPLAVGFVLLPLEMTSAPSPGKAGEASGDDPNGPTKGSAGGNRPITPSRSQPKLSASATSDQAWQRKPRNRQGASDAVCARERRHLERIVKSCGLLLETDPDKPHREILKAAPATPLRRSSKEQSSATRRLVGGLSAGYKDTRGVLGPRGACGGSAARLLQAERKRLSTPQPQCDGESSSGHRTRLRSAGSSGPQPEVVGGSRPGQRPMSAGSNSRSVQASASNITPSAQTQPSPHVHALPAPQTAAILHAALEGKVSVHLTHGPMSAASTASASEEGRAPSSSMQAAILAAALKGEIPVRSISTKPYSDDAAKAAATALSTSVGVTEISGSKGSSRRSSSDGGLGKLFQDGLVGVDGQLASFGGAFSEPSSSERDFELEEPDRELAPRCEVQTLQHGSW